MRKYLTSCILSFLILNVSAYANLEKSSHAMQLAEKVASHEHIESDSARACILSHLVVQKIKLLEAAEQKNTEDEAPIL